MVDLGIRMKFILIKLSTETCLQPVDNLLIISEEVGGIISSGVAPERPGGPLCVKNRKIAEGGII